MSKFDWARFFYICPSFVSCDLEVGGVPAVSPSRHPQKVFPVSVKFGLQIEVDDWCTTVYRMTRYKVKVMTAWKPLKRNRPSVLHRTNFLYLICPGMDVKQACLSTHISKITCPLVLKFSVHVTCGHSSVLLSQECNMLCTCGFVDDVVFTSLAKYRCRLGICDIADEIIHLWISRWCH